MQCIWDYVLLHSSSPPPPPLLLQPPLPVDPVDLRDWKDHGIDPGTPDSPPHAQDIDIALAALLKGLPGFNAEELDTVLNDLPLPEPWAKGGISVQEAAEVSFTIYSTLHHKLNNMSYAGKLASFPRWTGKHQVFAWLASVFYKTREEAQCYSYRKVQPRKVSVAEA